MANKKFGLGILVIALVFGMSVVGCDLDGANYNPAGTWDFTAGGQSATIVVSGNNWTFAGPFVDSGTFTRTGNALELFSNNLRVEIGTVMLTSNTTATVHLNHHSDIPGTFNATRR